MSQNTNVAIARTSEQVALLSDQQAKQVAEMAEDLDLHSPHGQRQLQQLASDPEISDEVLTAWLVEFGDVRMVNIIPAVRLSSRDELTGELSPIQKKANLSISLANAYKWA